MHFNGDQFSFFGVPSNPLPFLFLKSHVGRNCPGVSRSAVFFLRSCVSVCTWVGLLDLGSIHVGTVGLWLCSPLVPPSHASSSCLKPAH